jgi:signal transduction histidine kinase
MGRDVPSLSKNDLKGKITWLISIRWIAAGGLLAAIAGARFLLRVELPLLPLCLGALFLILYNCACLIADRNLEKDFESRSWLPRAQGLANIQVSVDLAVLTWLLHFSGGIENPFSLYFVFHMIISSILLTNRSAFLQATLAAALFGAVCLAETTGALPSYPLWREEGISSPYSIPRFLATFAVFVSALYICVYFTTTIVNQLRQHEAELEKSNAKLREQDSLRSRYVMAVSHDIRGPISGIESCLRVVQDGYTGTLPEKALEMIARASSRAKHLLTFVRDLLDVSKMRTQDRLRTERFPLVTQISQTAEALKPQLDAKRLAFRIAAPEGDPVVEADRHATDQLFGNLIGNAVRYTGEGGRIDVLVETGDQQGFVRVTVEDSGIGIPVESIPWIFDDFYRAGNAKALTEEGTGLGLSIVKRIVEMHGGKIWVESRLGEGTSFLLTLPLAR